LPHLTPGVEEIIAATPARKISFLYLANELLQDSRKKGMEFIQEYEKILPDVFANLANLDKDVKNKAFRLLQVWKERNLYPPAFIQLLESNLKPESSPIETSPPEEHVNKRVKQHHAPPEKHIPESVHCLKQSSTK
jgi:CID domain